MDEAAGDGCCGDLCRDGLKVKEQLTGMRASRDGRHDTGDRAFSGLVERTADEPDPFGPLDQRRVAATAAEWLRVVGSLNEIDGLAVVDHGLNSLHEYDPFRIIGQ
jgi:hypothetical protein